MLVISEDSLGSNQMIKKRIMRKRILLPILLSYTFVAHFAHAEANHNQNIQTKKVGRSVSSSAKSPKLRSNIALIFDEQSQLPVYAKNSQKVTPIASITKLMTAMVVLDAMLPSDEEVSIVASDRDKLKWSRSRLKVGMTFTRKELLKLALMASENIAASALARSYPGGKLALVAAMNAKAVELGMTNSIFVGPSGLSQGNVSTAQDLVKMVSAARKYPLIHRYTTSPSDSVEVREGREMRFANTNPLVRNVAWEIGVSKTGFISEAGQCLVMEANINDRSVIIILLNSWGKYTRTADANRIKRWMESVYAREHSVLHGES